jgi:ABC-type Zn2+ transport system substrate-binding protein/surface adhesin
MVYNTKVAPSEGIKNEKLEEEEDEEEEEEDDDEEDEEEEIEEEDAPSEDHNNEFHSEPNNPLMNVKPKMGKLIHADPFELGGAPGNITYEV